MPILAINIFGVGVGFCVTRLTRWAMLEPQWWDSDKKTPAFLLCPNSSNRLSTKQIKKLKNNETINSNYRLDAGDYSAGNG